MLIKLVSIEIIKIFGKVRSLLGFLALAVLMPLIIWGFSKGATGIERDIISGIRIAKAKNPSKLRFLPKILIISIPISLINTLNAISGK